MELDLPLGFATALSDQNLIALLAGVVVGLLGGLLPGISTAAILSIALPLTFTTPPQASLALLVGIAVGGEYGRTKVLAASLADDRKPWLYQVAAMLGAGVAWLVIVAVAPPLASFALSFGPREFVLAMAFVLVTAALLAPGPSARSFAAIVIGLLLATVGLDMQTGTARLTFGLEQLGNGIETIPLALGLFAFAEIVHGLEQAVDRPSAVELAESEAPPPAAAPPLPVAILASVVAGLLPGTRATRTGDPPVAADAAARHAHTNASFVPSLALGIPTSATTALLLIALLLMGVAPGPQLPATHPQLFWGVIAAVLIASVIAPLIPALGFALAVPYRVIGPLLLALCCVAAYVASGSLFGVGVMVVAGVLGYLLIKLQCERGLLLIAFVMGPMLEENFRRLMLLTRGDPTAVLDRPTLALIVFAAAVILVVRMRRKPSPEVQ